MGNIFNSENKSQVSGVTEDQLKKANVLKFNCAMCNNVLVDIIKDPSQTVGMPYKCALCKNNGIWNGKELQLQMDYINGNDKDYRTENMRFLCPNCNSQTYVKNNDNSQIINYDSSRNLVLYKLN